MGYIWSFNIVTYSAKKYGYVSPRGCVICNFSFVDNFCDFNDINPEILNLRLNGAPNNPG